MKVLHVFELLVEKLCVKDLVCERAVSGRVCVKDLVCKRSVCGRVARGRGMRLCVCERVVGDRVVCERLYVKDVWSERIMRVLDG